MQTPLKGKRVLVTGATGSIGQAVAVELAQQGVQVIASGRSKEKLASLQKLLEGEGHEMLPVDIACTENIEKLVKQAAAGGKLTGLVHCAGGGLITPLRTLTQRVLEDHMRLNFYAFVELTRQFTKKKYVSETGASIVGLSSFASTNGEQGQTAYAAAKAAMDAAVHTLAYELAPKKIRINSIRPGMIRSEATEGYLRDMGEERYNALVCKQLLGLGEPRDVALLCAYLQSDAARFMTGRCIYLDGGRL